MVKMVQEQHIDPALFALFIESGIWRDYARRFLAPSSWTRSNARPCWQDHTDLPLALAHKTVNPG